MIIARICWQLLVVLLCAVISLVSSYLLPAPEQGKPISGEEYVTPTPSPEPSEPSEPDERELPDLTYILHAGGVTPEGVAGSNSLEALDWSYEQGYRVMELDFSWTADGELACVHDWDRYDAYLVEGEVPTLAEFDARRSTAYGYTAMTMEHVAQWMEEHPDTWIVPDVKGKTVEALALIAWRYPDLQDRFIPQIYHTEEYEPVLALGYPDVFLTVYQMPLEERTDAAALAAFAEDHPLVGISIPTDLLREPGYLDGLFTAGVPIYTHTVNGWESQQLVFSMGLTGMFTDAGPAVE